MSPQGFVPEAQPFDERSELLDAGGAAAKLLGLTILTHELFANSIILSLSRFVSAHPVKLTTAFTETTFMCGI